MVVKGGTGYEMIVLVAVGFRKHAKNGTSRVKDRPIKPNHFNVRLRWPRIESKTSSGL